MKKILFLPIEVQTRELDSRILLATKAIEKGYKVVIGEMALIRKVTKFFKNGVFLDKDISELRSSHYKKMKDSGYNIFGLDVEGLIYLDRENYLLRVGDTSFKLIDYLFTWGKEQTDIIVSKQGEVARKKIKISGSPRMDLLRYNELYESEDIKKEKPYILFNTNFSFANSNRPNILEYLYETLEVHSESKIKGNKEKEEFWEGYYEYNKKIMASFVELIKYLSNKLEKHKIIIRPHPSESIEGWEKIFGDYSNIKIYRNESANHWIKNCELLIHNSCTTAIEANFLGKRVITYKPLSNDKFDQELPNKIGKVVEHKEEVYEAILEILNSNEEFKIENPLPNNINWEEKLSSEIMIETILENTNDLTTTCIDEKGWKDFKFNRKKKDFLRSNKKKIRKILGIKQKHRDEKMPGISLKEFNEKVRIFSKNDLSVEKISSDLFILKSDK